MYYHDSSEFVDLHVIVTPGMTPGLLQRAVASEIPVVPGISTPSEAMTLRERGFHFLKAFPAAPLGGPRFLAAMAGPLSDLVFCPTGGVRESDLVLAWIFVHIVLCSCAGLVVSRHESRDKA